MKRFYKIFLAVICLCALLVNLVACNIGNDNGDATPPEDTKTPTDPTEEIIKSEEFQTMVKSANAFSANLAAELYKVYGDEGNFVVSPISVYMALTIAAQCAASDTRDEILGALGITYELLQNDFASLYSSMNKEMYTYFDELEYKISLSNSVWKDDGATVKDDCASVLGDKFFCDVYSVDFDGDNAGANQAIREFVKEKTNNLIDQEFNLDPSTLFTLINTLYLKDVWLDDGRDLPYADGQYSFVGSDGIIKQIQLLCGFYSGGKVVETDNYTHYYIRTEHGNKLKFFLPKDGYTVGDIFTADNINAVNAITDYGADDYETQTHYYTRCIFPEFKANYSKDVTGVLQHRFGINKLFSRECDFSTLTENNVFCGTVQHVVKLNVDKKGIEGAAVTVIPDAGAMGPDFWEEVYSDFVVDRAFGFIITDRYDTALFAGVVGNV